MPYNLYIFRICPSLICAHTYKNLLWKWEVQNMMHVRRFFSCALTFAFYFVFSVLRCFFHNYFCMCALVCLCVWIFFVSLKNKYKSWNDFLSRYWCGMRDCRRAWDMFLWKGETHNYLCLSANFFFRCAEKNFVSFFQRLNKRMRKEDEKKKSKNDGKRERIITILKIMNFSFLSLH